jgi:hypothetical protein
MQIKPRSYPYPVLSHFGDDIVNSVFQPVVTVDGAKNAYVFGATFKTNNGDLVQLVAKKAAKYAVHVECVQTRYRNIFTSEQETFSFEIPSGMLDGRVEVCSFILASKPIEKYKNTDFHSDYAKLTFRIGKGDTLAVGHDREFTAEKKDDPLRKIPSIFSIQPDEDPNAAGMDIDTSGAKVVVRLSKPNFDAYAALRADQSLHSLLGAAIILPALVAVIDEIKIAASEEAVDSLSDRRWFTVVSRKLKEHGIDVKNAESFADSSLRLAHDLIGQPVNDCLKIQQKTLEEDE